MFLHVIHEGPNRTRDLLPQLRVRGQLAGMCIKAAMLRVVNACAEVGTQHLGHALEVLGDGIVWVCDSGRVLRGRCPENVGPLQSVSSRLTQKALDGIAARCPTVHLSEGL